MRALCATICLLALFLPLLRRWCHGAEPALLLGFHQHCRKYLIGSYTGRSSGESAVSPSLLATRDFSRPIRHHYQSSK